MKKDVVEQDMLCHHLYYKRGENKNITCVYGYKIFLEGYSRHHWLPLAIWLMSGVGEGFNYKFFFDFLKKIEI